MEFKIVVDSTADLDPDWLELHPEVMTKSTYGGSI